MHIDTEGWRFAAIPAAATVAIGIWAIGADSVAGLAVCGFFAAMTAFVLYFFRDPERHPPDDPDLVISPADGVVIAAEAGYGGGDGVGIAVFMNVFNVHVNRAPVAGTVKLVEHHPGRKLPADSPRAALENEYGETILTTPRGDVIIRQIAGLIARRVVTRVVAGDSIERCGRIGLIRFGSRVDVLLPDGYELCVGDGDRVRAGETVIARPSTGA